MKNKTIVGHSLVDDFEILKIDTKEQNCTIRDISNIKLFMKKKIDLETDSPVHNDSAGSKGSHRAIIQKRKLKDLAEEFLNAGIQDGHHSSVIDARTALALYRMHYEEIETKFRC